MASEAYVQVLPDSSGKRVRNLALEVLQADGTTAIVHMQVVSIVDQDGRAYTISNPAQVSDEATHHLLLRVVEMLEALVLKVSE